MDYRKTYSDAKAALETLQRQKANVENQLESLNGQIDAMTSTVNAIAPLVGERPVPTLRDTLINAGVDVLKAAGISVAVRAILDSQLGQMFTAPMIRDLLQKQGWDWEGYVNPLSTIHTVLKRLAEAEPAVAIAINSALGKGYKSTKVASSSLPPPPTTLRGVGGINPFTSNPLAGKKIK